MVNNQYQTLPFPVRFLGDDMGFRAEVSMYVRKPDALDSGAH